MRNSRVFAAALAVSLSACGGPAYVRVRSALPLNVNDANQSAPVDLRIYQLKDDGRFVRARVEDLWIKDQEILGDDLLVQRKITVFPGQGEDVSIGEFYPDCRFIGVLALFSRADDKGPRHLVLPAKDVLRRSILLHGSHLKLVD